MTKTRFDAYSVQGESFVSEDKAIQVNFNVHADYGIIASSTVFLTKTEAEELILELQDALKELSK